MGVLDLYHSHFRLKELEKHVVVLVLFCFHGSIFLHAQCNRYRSEIFNDVMITSVFYSDIHTSLQMDVYQPLGDTFFQRPVIIFAHAGQFLNGNASSDPAAVEFCTRFAKRGYVTCSIDYRLATVAQLMDTVQALTAFTLSVNDLKSAIRYMRKDASTTNFFGTDSAQIFIGGNEAGAVLANHCAFVDNILEIPPFYAEIINTHGGIEGDGGNNGWSSQVMGVVNWCGGINSTSYLSADDEPLFSAHGDADQVIDFFCNEALHSTIGTLANTLWLCGSGAMHPYAQSIGMSSTLLTFPGADTQPWISDHDIMDTVIEHTAEWLYGIVDCNTASGIDAMPVPLKFSVAPNPVHNNLFVYDENKNALVEIYNSLGERIFSAKRGANAIIDFSDYRNGIYVLKISDNNFVSQKILMKE